MKSLKCLLWVILYLDKTFCEKDKNCWVECLPGACLKDATEIWKIGVFEKDEVVALHVSTNSNSKWDKRTVLFFMNEWGTFRKEFFTKGWLHLSREGTNVMSEKNRLV